MNVFHTSGAKQDFCHMSTAYFLLFLFFMFISNFFFTFDESLEDQYMGKYIHILGVSFITLNQLSYFRNNSLQCLADCINCEKYHWFYIYKKDWLRKYGSKLLVRLLILYIVCFGKYNRLIIFNMKCEFSVLLDVFQWLNIIAIIPCLQNKKKWKGNKSFIMERIFLIYWFSFWLSVTLKKYSGMT